MRKNKIPLGKVQKAFNDAIKRRDCRCMVQDFDFCEGQLECSHFYTVGANPTLRFYPPNAYTQCQRHHWNHHNKKWQFYEMFLVAEHQQDWLKMQRLRHCIIKYTDELKAEIIKLCNEDRLDELTQRIEQEFGL